MRVNESLLFCSFINTVHVFIESFFLRTQAHWGTCMLNVWYCMVGAITFVPRRDKNSK